MTSDGVVEFLFHDRVPDMTAVQVVACHLTQAHYPHSYKSAIVALDGEDVAAMAISYPSACHRISAEMTGFGFRVVADVALAQNAFIHHTDGCLLLTYEMPAEHLRWLSPQHHFAHTTGDWHR